MSEGAPRTEKQVFDQLTTERLKELSVKRTAENNAEITNSLNSILNEWAEREYPAHNAPAAEQIEYNRRIAQILFEGGFFEEARAVLSDLIPVLQRNGMETEAALCLADLKRFETTEGHQMLQNEIDAVASGRRKVKVHPGRLRFTNHLE